MRQYRSTVITQNQQGPCPPPHSIFISHAEQTETRKKSQINILCWTLYNTARNLPRSNRASLDLYNKIHNTPCKIL